jgi:hypothetical protein
MRAFRWSFMPRPAEIVNQQAGKRRIPCDFHIFVKADFAKIRAIFPDGLKSGFASSLPIRG